MAGSPHKVENQEACAKLTASKEGALFWTYRDSDKKCWIKTSKKGKMPLKTVVSGNRECGEEGGEGEEGGDEDAKEANEGCEIEEEIDYRAHNMAGSPHKVENQEACAKLTASKEGALFWTYRDSDKKCWIKTSKKGKTPLKTVVSGNRECGL